jgi:hypothetical protein
MGDWIEIDLPDMSDVPLHPEPWGMEYGAWGPRAIVVWSPRARIYHLPGELGEYGLSLGARRACNQYSGTGATFILRFTQGWGLVPCQRCFTRTGRPRRKYRPATGWWLSPSRITHSRQDET